MRKLKKSKFERLLMNVIPEQINGELPLWDNFIASKEKECGSVTLYEYLLFLYFGYEYYLESSEYLPGLETFVGFIDRQYPLKKQATRKR